VALNQQLHLDYAMTLEVKGQCQGQVALKLKYAYNFNTKLPSDLGATLSVSSIYSTSKTIDIGVPDVLFLLESVHGGQSHSVSE
jgi:hypothetical protein